MPRPKFREDWLESFCFAAGDNHDALVGRKG